MKRLKFRVWIKDIKEMLDVFSVGVSENGGVRCIGTPKTPTRSMEYWYLSSDLYELMQFTGIIDINGKEIYEGDVVIPDSGGASLVHWKDGAFQVGYYGDIPYVLADYKSLTVIGNIYENPELKKELIDVIDD